jgi:uncharacterized membrane protein
MKIWGSAYDGSIEGVLAATLRNGTAIACVILAASLILHVFPALRATSEWLGKAGIVAFISLPILRVSIMAVLFSLKRDVVFAAISATVLLVICLGAALSVALVNAIL